MTLTSGTHKGTHKAFCHGSTGSSVVREFAQYGGCPGLESLSSHILYPPM